MEINQHLEKYAEKCVAMALSSEPQAYLGAVAGAIRGGRCRRLACE